MQSKPSFTFYGTPDVARDTLELLKISGYIPELIITGPDRPVGRHFVMTAPPVKIWAQENNIPILQPEKITSEFITSLPKTDIAVVVAYGKILSQSLIDHARYGTFNIHYSLLPRWRGASPVEAAILHGDATTGVTVQKMVFALDAGPVVGEKQIPIEITDTTETLRAKLIPLGTQLLIEKIFETPMGTWYMTDQNEHLMTHCGKTKKEDALITLSDDPKNLWNKYRAYHHWPQIYFLDEQKKRVKITTARFEMNQFIIEKVIPEGKKEIAWSDYKNSK